jgi:hypothetical protein
LCGPGNCGWASWKNAQGAGIGKPGEAKLLYSVKGWPLDNKKLERCESKTV